MSSSGGEWFEIGAIEIFVVQCIEHRVGMILGEGSVSCE
jgi:hypothetical protein